MSLTPLFFNANVGTAGGALLPMSLAPTGFTTNYLTTTSVPVYYTYVAQGLAPAPPILGAGPSTNPSPLLPNASSLATLGQPGAGTDILVEYNAFVVGESSAYPAGVDLAPSDATQFGTTFAPLSSAVGGPHRLGSIGRFLRSRINDPNFQARGFDLIGRIIAIVSPGLTPAIEGLRPVIKSFLDQMKQGAQGGLAPLPPPDVHGGSPGRGLPVGANGELRVRVVFENAPPPGRTHPEKPGDRQPREAMPVKTFTDLIEKLGLTIVGQPEPDGTFTIKKSDGSTVKVNPSQPPKPPAP
ncbi:MAG: hypothetical protein NVSMB9_31200 [Isosphaeraceae bacterium]